MILVIYITSNNGLQIKNKTLLKYLEVRKRKEKQGKTQNLNHYIKLIKVLTVLASRDYIIFVNLLLEAVLMLLI